MRNEPRPAFVPIDATTIRPWSCFVASHVGGGRSATAKLIAEHDRILSNCHSNIGHLQYTNVYSTFHHIISLSQTHYISLSILFYIPQDPLELVIPSLCQVKSLHTHTNKKRKRKDQFAHDRIARFRSTTSKASSSRCQLNLPSRKHTCFSAFHI